MSACQSLKTFFRLADFNALRQIRGSRIASIFIEYSPRIGSQPLGEHKSINRSVAEHFGKSGGVIPVFIDIKSQF